MILLLKLILAHLIADFLLQPNGWVKAKRKHMLNSWQLYVHSAIHGILPFVFVAKFWFLPYAIILAVFHFLIDAGKLYLTKKYQKTDWFFLDQLAHLLVIVGIWGVITHPAISVQWLENPKIWLAATALYLLTFPAAVTISHIMRSWTLEIENSISLSLANSGKYIGIFERLLMFAFICYNQWAAIGLLITAKSVFRFGDLKNERERKLTEYILLGSLISMLWAVAVTLGFLALCKNINI